MGHQITVCDLQKGTDGGRLVGLLRRPGANGAERPHDRNLVADLLDAEDLP